MEQIPQWIWDWSGSICVAISLYFLWYKRYAYWHFSNASLAPYFILFVSLGSYMLAGLQLIFFLFGLHGMMLWWLENREHPWARSGGTSPRRLSTSNLTLKLHSSQ